ncbi:MAG: WYL domain-containing protein [Phycisphaerales bacterium]|nr:WYL domain-containing protein [Phycisphaerales bacterium]
MKYTRIHRLLRIISLLQSGKPQRTPDLAVACGTTERTIFRDLGEIQKAGIPVGFDRKAKSYRIDGDFFMPPVALTVEEALALATLAEQIGDTEQVPFLRLACRGLAKITAQLPPSVKDEVWDLSRSRSIRTGPTTPSDGCADVFDRIQLAIAEGRVLKCRYEAASGEDRAGTRPFTFKPYALFFAVRAWYAIGQRSDRRGLRSLKINRFAAIELTSNTYEIPRGFTLDRYLGNAWRMIRGDVDHHVEIRVDAEFALTVSETLWHRTMETDHHPDGSCTLSFTVSGFDEIQWWVLSMGPHCRVVKPKELATRVAALAEQTAAQYRAAGAKSARVARRPGRDDGTGAGSAKAKRVREGVRGTSRRQAARRHPDD